MRLRVLMLGVRVWLASMLRIGVNLLVHMRVLRLYPDVGFYSNVMQTRTHEPEGRPSGGQGGY